MGQRIAYEMPVVLTGAQVREAIKMRGEVLIDPVKVQGVCIHDGGTLVFLGFAGTVHQDGMCHGHYRFRRVQPQDEERDQLALSDLPASQEAYHGAS